MAGSLKSLDRLPLVDDSSGEFNVVVETPKGSRTKYKYDPSCGAMRLGASAGEGLVFPHDFGFFPSTLGADGDPLDVVLFADSAVVPGCVATARLIGVLEVEQKEKRQPWKRNDRYFAVATQGHEHERLERLDDLGPTLVSEIEQFFVHYARLNGKTLRIVRRSGSRRARKLLKTGAEAFRSKGQDR